MTAIAKENLPLEATGQLMVGIGVTQDRQQRTGALWWAAEQAWRTRRTLCLVHAWSPWDFGPAVASASLYGCAPGPEQIQADRHQAAQRLGLAARQVRRVFPDLPLRARLLEGQPATCLAAASIGADSLVLGPSSAGRLRAAIGGRMCVTVAAEARVPIVRVRPTPNPGGPVVAVAYGLDDLAAILPSALRLAAQQCQPTKAVILTPARRPRHRIDVPTLEAAVFDLLAISRQAFPGAALSGMVAQQHSALDELLLAGRAPGVILACPRGYSAAARARRRDIARIVARAPGSAMLVPTGP